MNLRKTKQKFIFFLEKLFIGCLNISNKLFLYLLLFNEKLETIFHFKKDHQLKFYLIKIFNINISLKIVCRTTIKRIETTEELTTK